MNTRLITLCIAVFIFSQSLFSQAGTPDKSFGNNGVAKILVPLSDGENHVVADRIVQQKDGKYLVGVRSFITNFIEYLSYHVFLYRFKKNGMIDSSFGQNGRVTLYAAKNTLNEHYFFDLVLDSAGRILATTQTKNSLGLTIVRLKPDGSADTGFGNKGGVNISLGTDQIFQSNNTLTLQPDGKILVAVGQSKKNNTATLVFRLNENGSRDSSFNNNGYTSYTPDGLGAALIWPLGLQPSKKIISYGSHVLIRFNEDGTRDMSFGNNGSIKGKDTVYTGRTWYESLYNLKVLPDGRFMCFGKLTLTDHEGGGYSTNKVYRFTKNGQPDNSFNSTGQVTIFSQYYLNREPQLVHLLLQPDEKFLFYDNVEWEGDNKIYRYLKNGKIDKSFADGGSINLSEYGMYMTISDMFLQKNLKITALGTYYSDLQTDTGYFYIFRYNNDMPTAEPSAVAVENTISSKLENGLSIRLSPNPATSILTVSDLIGNTKLSIVNAAGKTVREANASSDVFNWNVQNLPAGNYFLVASQHNKVVASIQFIRQ